MVAVQVGEVLTADVAVVAAAAVVVAAAVVTAAVAAAAVVVVGRVVGGLDVVEERPENMAAMHSESPIAI